MDPSSSSISTTTSINVSQHTVTVFPNIYHFDGMIRLSIGDGDEEEGKHEQERDSGSKL